MVDTSVLAASNEAELARVAAELVASSLTVAELAGGPHAAGDDFERKRRCNRLRLVEASIEALPFDSVCAQAYGRVYAAVERIGRKPRGSRAVDLMIAATALAHGLPLYTLNSKDLHGLEGLIEIVDVGR